MRNSSNPAGQNVLQKPIIWKNTWCVPQDTAGQLIPWDTIIACTNERYASAAGNIAEEEGEFGIGVDVARMSDLHCYIALKPWHDRFIVRLVYYHKDHSWKSRDKKLDEMTGTEGVKLVVIDQTSIGDKYVMDAKERKNGTKCAASFSIMLQRKN